MGERERSFSSPRAACQALGGDDADGSDFKGDLEAAESLFRFGDQNDTSPGVRAAPIGATSRTLLLEPSFWTFIAVSSCLTTCRRRGGSHTAYFRSAFPSIERWALRSSQVTLRFQVPECWRKQSGREILIRDRPKKR